MEQDDRDALDQLKQDQAYRKRLTTERTTVWNRTAVAASLLAAGAGVAALVAQLVHLL